MYKDTPTTLVVMCCNPYILFEYASPDGLGVLSIQGSNKTPWSI